MKKITALFTVLALMLGLCACSTKNELVTWQEQYDLGVRYLSEGNYQEAIIAFTAAIEIDPKQAEAYVGLADAYIGIGDYTKASEAIAQGQIACGNDESFDRILNNLSFLQSGESGIKITSFYFDKGAYLVGKKTDFLVSVAYRCPENQDCILMIGANTKDPYSFAMMDKDYQVTGNGGYQFHVSVTPVQWEESYFGIYVNLSEADHAETWTPFAMDVLYIDEYGDIVGTASYGSNENDGNTLLEQGVTDNMLQFEEINFFGHSIVDLDIETMKSILNQNGFEVNEQNQDDHLWIGTSWIGTDYGAEIHALQHKDEDYVTFWGYTHYSSNAEDEPLPIGVRGIYTYDSFATVLSQLGFSNGAEVEAHLNEIANKRFETRDELSAALEFLECRQSSIFIYVGGVGSRLLDDGGDMLTSLEIAVHCSNNAEKNYQLRFSFENTVGIEFSYRLIRYSVNIYE